MIRARSTYTFVYNLDVVFNTIIKIYIWQGDSGVVPAEPIYTVTDLNPASELQRSLNLAPLVLDFIEKKIVAVGSSGLVDLDNAVNVSIDREVNGVTTNIFSDLATRGYYSAIEGSNIGLPTNKILMQGDYMKTSRESVVLIPLVPDNTNIQVLSSPSGEINIDTAVSTSVFSSQAYKGMLINCSEAVSDSQIVITYNLEEYVIDIIDELRYSPLDIFFINKEGFLQSFTFFKERKDKTQLNKEVFQRTGVSVFNGEHQFVDYNFNSRSKFSVNSGFVEEDQNETFKQMFLSEAVWQYDGSKFIPLNIDSTNLEYLTRTNDKLIKYTIDFSYSFDDIQTL